MKDLLWDIFPYLIVIGWFLGGIWIVIYSLKRFVRFCRKQHKIFPFDVVVFWCLIGWEYIYSYRQPVVIFDMRFLEFGFWAALTGLGYGIIVFFYNNRVR